MPIDLTAEAVLAMPAGEELDELVATMVLGWRRRQQYWVTARGAFIANLCPMLSNNLGAAEPVLDWLHERWGAISITHNGINWQVMELERSNLQAVVLRADRVVIAYADTLPLALCRAALLEVIRDGK